MAKIAYLKQEKGKNRILDEEKWVECLMKKNVQNRILDEAKWPK